MSENGTSEELLALSTSEQDSIKDSESSLTIAMQALGRITQQQFDLSLRISQLRESYAARVKKIAALHGIDLDSPDCGKWELDVQEMRFKRKNEEP